MTDARVKSALRSLFGAVVGFVVVLLVNYCSFRLHFNLASAASVDIVIVLLITLWFGFWQATATSIAAVACLAYFFAPPILSFYVADPHNWVALAAFELTALIVSHLSNQAKNEKRRAVRSEKEHRELLETMPFIAYVARPDGAGEFQTPGWLKYSGLLAEASLGYGWKASVHPDDLERHMSKWAASVESGQPFENEVRHRSATGEYRWFLTRAVPLRDEDGKILKWFGVLTDIEDRKRSEEALRRSEKELRDLFENIPAVAFYARPDGFNEFQSRAWFEYSGQRVEDSLGYGWTATVHPDDVKSVATKLAKDWERGEPFEEEIRYRSKTGEYRSFLARVAPLRDESGKVLKWFGVVTDIDDRKRAESLLAGEKHILEMVAKGDSLDQILEALCRLVEEQVSGTLASILLLDGDLLRRGAAPSLPKAYIDAIDGAAIGLLAGSCATAAYRGEQVIIEDIATDPSWAHCRAMALQYSVRACWSTPVFSSQGKVIAAVEMYYREPRKPTPKDQELIEQITHLAGVVTERKLIQEALRRSEAHLAESQRLAKIGSWAWNLRTGEVFWSQEVYRICGLDPEMKRTWLQFLNRVHPEDRAKIEQERKMESTEKDWTVSEIEFRVVLSDGTLKHVRATSYRVTNDSGETTEVFGTFMDETERKRAEQERERLRQLEANLTHMNRVSVMGDMTASIAHELNQPLAGVVSNGSACLRWLGGDSPNLEEAREAARRIVRDGKRAGEIISRIRALASKAVTPKTKLDLNETIGEVLALVGDETKRGGIAVRTEFAETLAPVLGDRVQLQQVVLNIIMNGLDAMNDAASKQLLIATRNVDGGQVQVTVTDTGIGIDPDRMEKVFDPFYSTKPHGMGMGLSISRSIIQSHGGRLWVTANDGPGIATQFTIPQYRQ
jgi:PAS domain S-box-containing protein